MENAGGTMSVARLRELQQLDVAKLDVDALVDIRTVRIDPDQPIERRVMEYLAQVRNPYAFRVGDTPVRIVHLPGGRTIEDALKSHLQSIRD